MNNSPIPKFSYSEHLIPLEAKPVKNAINYNPKIVIGHNVGYDRTRVREQYYEKVLILIF